MTVTLSEVEGRVSSFQFRISNFDLSNLFDCVVAVHNRHPQIHPDKMWGPVLPDIKCFLSVRRFLDLKTERGQEFHKQ